MMSGVTAVCCVSFVKVVCLPCVNSYSPRKIVWQANLFRTLILLLFYR